MLFFKKLHDKAKRIGQIGVRLFRLSHFAPFNTVGDNLSATQNNSHAALSKAHKVKKQK